MVKKKLKLFSTGQDTEVFLDGYYVSVNGRLFIGKMHIHTEYFYSFFYNENSVATTMIKKEVVSGSKMYDYHSIEKMKLKVKPYIYVKQDDGVFVTLYDL